MTEYVGELPTFKAVYEKCVYISVKRLMEKVQKCNLFNFFK